MRFAIRASAPDPDSRAALYAATIDMAQWAETKNCAGAILSQHHAVEDGYLPSPVPLAAAMAARTRTIPINVAALLLALYEPVKLAEDLAVVDLISRGRVSYVVGIGYRDEEFAMFGVVRRGTRRRGRGADPPAPAPVVRRTAGARRADGPGHAPAVHPGWPVHRLRRGDRGGGPSGGASRVDVHGRDARRLARAGLPRRGRRRGSGMLLPARRCAPDRLRGRGSRASMGGDRPVPARRCRQLLGLERHTPRDGVDLAAPPPSPNWPPRRAPTRS